MRRSNAPKLLTLLLCAAFLAMTLPTGTADLDPPEPGEVKITNNLALVNGACEGTVTAEYAFVTIDTPWALRYDVASNCAITPKVYEGPATETYAWQVGGGFVGASFAYAYDEFAENLIWHGLNVAWPVAQCPTHQKYHQVVTGSFSVSGSTTGTCLKEFYNHSQTVSYSNAWMDSWLGSTTQNGHLYCDTDFGPLGGGGCWYGAYGATEVPGWVVDAIDGVSEPSTELGEIPSASGTVEPIH